MFKQYLKEVIPLYLFIMLFVFTVFNTHIIVDYITKMVMHLTSGLDDTIVIIGAIIVYIIESTVMLFIADKMDKNKED